jgi:hypothetical protein
MLVHPTMLPVMFKTRKISASFSKIKSAMKKVFYQNEEEFILKCFHIKIMMRAIHRLIVIATFLSYNISAFGQYDEMLHELNPGNFNKDYTNYDPATALFNAQLSELAYWKDDKINKFHQKVVARYPDQRVHYRLLECDKKCNDVQALLWGTKEFLVIALRGTEPKVFTDWITDGKFWNYENTPEANEPLGNMPPGHGGFRKSLMNLINKNDLFKDIEDIIKKCNANADPFTFPIYLTGHSLGAAISQLLMEPLAHKKFNFSGAYHFAPPLAVACSVNEIFKKKFGSKTYDIVNFKDYVPRAGRNGVAHFGTFLRICDDNLIYKEKESYINFRGKEYFSEFKLHSLRNHIEAIRKAENTSQNILQRSVQTYNCLIPQGELNFCPD